MAKTLSATTPEQAKPSLWLSLSDGGVSPGAPLSAAALSLLELPDSAPRSVIRDSLYDVIPLGALELDLLETPAFIRLQGIKQLGFVYRIWPGATHTRFEHSLGVYFLMMRALRAMLARAANAIRAGQTHSHDAALSRLGDELPTTLRTLLAAAMLHDCGHYPFSHAIEELGAPIIPHERVGRRIIESGAVAAILERHGLSPQRVADLIDPPRDRALPLGDGLLIRLLSGPLDVDKLDYLPRDARSCNVPYGGVDVTRLLDSLRLLPAALDAAHGHEAPLASLRLGVSDKGISPLNSLLHARQEMFDNVYWHHTNRAMMAMLLRAVQEALLAGMLSSESLPGYDDSLLLMTLSGEAMPAATRALVDSLRGRRPYKTLLEVSARAGSVFQLLDTLFWDQAKRRRVEIALAEAANAALGESLSQPLNDYDILVDVPKPEKWEVDTLVAFSQPPLGMAPLMTWTEATGQRPDDLGVYERRQRRIRLVASDAVRGALADRVVDIVLPVIERIPML